MSLAGLTRRVYALTRFESRLQKRTKVFPEVALGIPPASPIWREPDSDPGSTNIDSVLPFDVVIGVSLRNHSQIASGTRYCFPPFGHGERGVVFYFQSNTANCGR